MGVLRGEIGIRTRLRVLKKLLEWGFFDPHGVNGCHSVAIASEETLHGLGLRARHFVTVCVEGGRRDRMAQERLHGAHVDP
jgi:hypothetical protein